jgi:hypothetical protein
MDSCRCLLHKAMNMERGGERDGGRRDTGVKLGPDDQPVTIRNVSKRKSYGREL